MYIYTYLYIYIYLYIMMGVQSANIEISWGNSKAFPSPGGSQNKQIQI